MNTRGLPLVTLSTIAAALLVAGCVVLGNGTGSGTNSNSRPTMHTYMHPTPCQVLTPTTSTAVTVTVSDHRMGSMMTGTNPASSRLTLVATPATVAAGHITFVVTNRGMLTHELVVLPLTRGQKAGHRTTNRDDRINEHGSLGEASATCAPGPGTGIAPHSTRWVTLTLPKGRYELLCNIAGHYAAGMHQDLTVT